MQKSIISFSFSSLLICMLFFMSKKSIAQGTWTPLATLSPDTNGGVMLLLTDGRVLARTYTGGGDGIGNVWNILKPDTFGSYINGKWSSASPANDTRLYFASQVLKDGRVFVAGGEYGTGGSAGETYDPVTDIWTPAPFQSQRISDANSKLLPDGKVMVALVSGSYDGTIIFDPKTNNWLPSPTCLGNHDESSWLKLQDSSILFVDIGSTVSERFIPKLNQWIPDANVPVQLYDPLAYETGAGFLLPDGRAWFIGGYNSTAYYTPSGNTTPGVWAAGPNIPGGYGAVDAAAAMMVNGKILFCVSPIPVSGNLYSAPTAYYEFNYLTNTFLQILAPGGGGLDTLSEPCYYTNMLDLPNGQVLYSDQGSNKYFVYTPNGAPLAAGKPTIGTVAQITCDTFRVTGTLFNGISDGAAYGDDWQMATNYPIVRLTKGSYVYYAKSFNWNSTGSQRGSLPDTSFFTLPANLTAGTYSLAVIANGIASNSNTFVYTPCTNGITATENISLSVYPNPVNEIVNLELGIKNSELVISDVLGKTVRQLRSTSEKTYIDVSDLQNGVYLISIKDKAQKTIASQKIIVQH